MRSNLAFVCLLLMSCAASLASAECYTFYGDLCPGPYSCMCTKREPCGGKAGTATPGNRSAAMNELGGCAGECRTVEHDVCPGPDSCMKDVGECIIPTPQPPTPSTQFGVDFATPFDNSTFECLAKNDITFGVVRAHHSDGGIDTNSAPMIQKMRAHAFKHVDAYLFPCTTFDRYHTAELQVNRTVDYLIAQDAKPDRIWFDIEHNPDPSCGWHDSNSTYNCAFFSELVMAAAKKTVDTGIQFGVYAGLGTWQAFFGAVDASHPGCDAGKHLPLWYAHYQRPPVISFQDWTTPYGGWTAPTAKQYNDRLDICNVGGGMDANWAPNGFH